MSENPSVNPVLKCPEVSHFDEGTKKFILMDCIKSHCGKWSPEFQSCGYKATPMAALVLAESLVDVISNLNLEVQEEEPPVENENKETTKGDDVNAEKS